MKCYAQAFCTGRAECVTGRQNAALRSSAKQKRPRRVHQLLRGWRSAGRRSRIPAPRPATAVCAQELADLGARHSGLHARTSSSAHRSRVSSPSVRARARARALALPRPPLAARACPRATRAPLLGAGSARGVGRVAPTGRGEAQSASPCVVRLGGAPLPCPARSPTGCSEEAACRSLGRRLGDNALALHPCAPRLILPPRRRSLGTMQRHHVPLAARPHGSGQRPCCGNRSCSQRHAPWQPRWRQRRARGETGSGWRCACCTRRGAASKTWGATGGR